MKKQFYERLLPPTGVYCVSAFTNGVMKNRFTETLDGVIQLTDLFNTEGADVYVAPNSFTGHSRQSKYASRARSLFVDLDVGEAKEYSSQAEALDSLDEFLCETSLPMPTVLNSGTGIQAYWILTEDMPVDEWRPIAEDFKQFCISKGLKIDAVVTADASRLMRCPDTYNHKTNPPNPTYLLGDIDVCELSQIMKAMKAMKGFCEETDDEFRSPLPISKSPKTLLPEVLGQVQKGLDDDTSAVSRNRYDDLESYYSDIIEKSLNGTGCEQIRRLVTEPTRQSYNEWFWGLSIAVRCTDGAEAIHEFSKGHPGYDRNDTIAKANETLKATGPQKCQIMESIYPSGCEGCPHRGHIGSPLALGRRVKPLPPEKMPEEVPTLPESIAPYSWSEGGIWYTPPATLTKEGKWSQNDPYLICSTIFYPLCRMYGKEEGAVLVMRAVLPRDPEREFELPIKHLGASDKFREILASQDVTPSAYTPTMVNRMMDYTLKWNDYLKSIQSAEIMQMQMGWTENNASFVAGFREVTYTGEVRRTASSLAVKQIAKMLNPVGTLEAWKESANALNAPGMEHLALGLLSGFGSPLMQFTNTPGVSICFQGSAGDGKSGALFSGLSVWGDPQQIAPQEKGATVNALVQRYVNLKNILMGLDEVQNIAPEALSNFIFAISTGKGKIRLQSSRNAERDIESQARLLCVMTSNADLHSVLKMNKSNPEGEVRRFIQFLFRKPPQFIHDPDLAPKIIEPFNKNYGHAGVEFIKALYEFGGEKYARDRIEDWGNRFSESYGKHTRYSHYKSAIAVHFAAGEIAMRANLINFDLNRIYKVVVDDMIYDRDMLGSQAVDYAEVLNTFYNDNIGLFLTMDGTNVIEAPIYFKEFIGRKEIDTRIVYVHRVALQRYLMDNRRKINVSQFEHHLRESGIMLHSKKKKRLGAHWSTGSNIGNVDCYWFKMDVKDVTTPDTDAD